MTASVREQLIAAIITAVGGQYSLSVPEDPRDLPVTIVQDGDDDAATSYDTTRLTMPIGIGRIEVATGIDRTVMRAQANAALAALITAMHLDETFGGLALGVDYTGGGIQLEAGKLVFAEASFAVRYQHLRGQPAVIS